MLGDVNSRVIYLQLGFGGNSHHYIRRIYNSTDQGESSISSESYNANSMQISPDDNASANTMSQAGVDMEEISTQARGSTGNVDSVGMQSESTVTSDRRGVRISRLDNYHAHIRNNDITVEVTPQRSNSANSDSRHRVNRTEYFTSTSVHIPQGAKASQTRESQIDKGYNSGSTSDKSTKDSTRGPPPPYQSDNNIPSTTGQQQTDQEQFNQNATAKTSTCQNSEPFYLPPIDDNDIEGKRKPKHPRFQSNYYRSAPALAEINAAKANTLHLEEMPNLSESLTTKKKQLTNHPLHISRGGSSSLSFGQPSSQSNDISTRTSSSSQQFAMEITDTDYEDGQQLSLYTNPIHQQNLSYSKTSQYLQDYDMSSFCHPVGSQIAIIS